MGFRRSTYSRSGEPAIPTRSSALTFRLVDTVRWTLFSLTLIGSGLTIWGLVSAYFNARSEVSRAGDRIETGKKLAAQEQAAIEALTVIRTQQATSEIHSRFERKYAEHDLVRPSRAESPYLAAHETKRLVGLLLDSTRSNLVWAGVGLLISTLAAAASLVLL